MIRREFIVPGCSPEKTRSTKVTNNNEDERVPGKDSPWIMWEKKKKRTGEQASKKVVQKGHGGRKSVEKVRAARLAGSGEKKGNIWKGTINALIKVKIARDCKTKGETMDKKNEVGEGSVTGTRPKCGNGQLGESGKPSFE